MSDPTYPLFPVCSFLGFFLVLVPLPWHLQAWNSGTCYFMLWTSLACLNQFVNSVVWAGNALNPAPVWCDISTRIIIGASVGIPAASLCINRRLYGIACVQMVSVSKGQKRKAIICDSLICVLFPMVVIALSYIVQGHRFNIYGDLGCSPAIYNTLPAYFLLNWWPVLIGVISAIYCGLSLRSFARRRAQFHEFMNSNKSSLTLSRYFRLMALASTEIMLTIPIASFAIYLNLTAAPLGPWVSLSDTHFAFSRVDQVPSVMWHMNRQFVIAQELTRWLNPACAFVFIAYFGFADEARKHYKQYYQFVRAKLGFNRPDSQAAFRCKGDLLPSYNSPRKVPVPRVRPDSLASILQGPFRPRPAMPTSPSDITVVDVKAPVPAVTKPDAKLSPVASSFGESDDETAITLGDLQSLCDAPLSPSSCSTVLSSPSSLRHHH